MYMRGGGLYSVTNGCLLGCERNNECVLLECEKNEINKRKDKKDNGQGSTTVAVRMRCTSLTPIKSQLPVASVFQQAKLQRSGNDLSRQHLICLDVR